MKIAILTGPKEFQFQDEQLPALLPDEVLVQVAACGVCTSELDVWEGKEFLHERREGKKEARQPDCGK